MEAIFATDAPDTHIAAVQTDPEVAREAYAYSLQKGTWSRLLAEPQAWLRARRLLTEEDELPEG